MRFAVAALLAGLALGLLPGCAIAPDRTAAPTPAARRSPGPLSDTWSFDGSAWRKIVTRGPSARESPGLAYDPQHGVFVLFGGNTATGASDETWTWDGRSWQLRAPAHRPKARGDPAMAFDPRGQVVVLYGGIVAGRGEGDAGDDTWTWDGADWKLVDAGPGLPGRREGARLVAAGDRVLLFGGREFNVKYYGDVWTWNGKAWSPVSGEPGPAGRGDSAVAWDQSREALFVFGGVGFKAAGGIGGQGKLLADGWSLTGSTWTPLEGTGPPALSHAAALWDAPTRRIVMLLGYSCPKLSDAAWAWNGKAWLRLPATGIPPRSGAGVAQDPGGKALLFGGSDAEGCFG